MDEREIQALRACHVAVFGCGAAGGNLAEHLARMGVGSLALLDRDRVGPENLGLQPYETSDVGRTKVRALADRLGRAMPDLRVLPLHGPLDAKLARRALAFDGLKLVVDAFDNVESRALAGRLAGAASVSCLHVGLSGDGFAEASWGEAYALAPAAAPDPCRVPLSRGLCLVLAALAGKALAERVAEQVEHSYSVTWKDLVVTRHRAGGAGRLL